LRDNVCTDDWIDWNFIFIANFDVGGGSLHIGSAFEDLVDRGNAKKPPGKGLEGTTAVRLQVIDSKASALSCPACATSLFIVFALHLSSFP
jgi:hypothetical protein